MEDELNEFRQINSKLELQLSEQNLLLEDHFNRIKVLEIEQRGHSELMQTTMNQISQYLQVKLTVDDLTKSTVEENLSLKANNEALQSKLMFLETQIQGYQDQLELLSNTQKNWEAGRSSIERNCLGIVDIASEFQNRLNKLISNREKALADSIACSPNDSLVRRNKQLNEDIEKTAHDNMTLRAEINDLKAALKLERERNDILIKEVG